MKKLIIIGAMIAPLLSSCDPYGASDNLTVAIPPLEFKFDITPDTAYIKLGDTITFYTAIENPTLENGERLKDGKTILMFGGAWCRNTPRTDDDTSFGLKYEEHFLYEMPFGGVNILENKSMNRLYAYPDGGDSIRIAFKFIPLKAGTYIMGVQSNFFEGSQGKSRTNAKFNILNNNLEDLTDFDGEYAQPDDLLYYRNFCFAVYE